MPTYEYECTNCGRKFDMLQSITARPKRLPTEPCAGCGIRAPIRRLIGSGGAVLFKGSGFYETDYRSESYKKAAKAETERHSGESTKSTEKGNSKSDLGAKTESAPARSDAVKSSKS